MSIFLYKIYGFFLLFVTAPEASAGLWAKIATKRRKSIEDAFGVWCGVNGNPNITVRYMSFTNVLSMILFFMAHNITGGINSLQPIPPFSFLAVQFLFYRRVRTVTRHHLAK